LVTLGTVQKKRFSPSQKACIYLSTPKRVTSLY
jgi:hypothetical protein